MIQESQSIQFASLDVLCIRNIFLFCAPVIRLSETVPPISTYLAKKNGQLFCLTPYATTTTTFLSQNPNHCWQYFETIEIKVEKTISSCFPIVIPPLGNWIVSLHVHGNITEVVKDFLNSNNHLINRSQNNHKIKFYGRSMMMPLVNEILHLHKQLQNIEFIQVARIPITEIHSFALLEKFIGSLRNHPLLNQIFVDVEFRDSTGYLSLARFRKLYCTQLFDHFKGVTNCENDWLQRIETLLQRHNELPRDCQVFVNTNKISAPHWRPMKTGNHNYIIEIGSSEFKEMEKLFLTARQ